MKKGHPSTEIRYNSPKKKRTKKGLEKFLPVTVIHNTLQEAVNGIKIKE